MAGLVTFAFLPADLQLVLSSEAAWVEMSSAILLATIGILILFLRPLKAWAHLSLLAFVLAEREMEAEVLQEGVLRSAIEWVDKVFLHNKIVMAILLLWLIYGLVRYTLPMLRQNFRAQKNVLALIFIGVLFASTGQLIDKGFLAEETTMFAGTTLSAWEELFELYFSIFLFFATLLGLYEQRKDG